MSMHHSSANRKQVAVATAQILFQRFWFVTSMKQFGVGVRRATVYILDMLNPAGHWHGGLVFSIEIGRVSATDARSDKRL